MRLLAVVRLPFYVVKVPNNWPKILTFSAWNVLDQLLTPNMYKLILTKSLFLDQKEWEIVKNAGLILLACPSAFYFYKDSEKIWLSP